MNTDFVKGFVQNLPYWWRDYWQLSGAERWGRFERVGGVRKTKGANGEPASYDLGDVLDDVSRVPEERRALMQVHLQAIMNYVPQSYGGTVTVFHGHGSRCFVWYHPGLGWASLALGGVEVRPIAGFHRNLLEEPHVEVLARELRGALGGSGDWRLEIGDL